VRRRREQRRQPGKHICCIQEAGDGASSGRIGALIDRLFSELMLHDCCYVCNCSAAQDKNLDDPNAKERFQDLLEAKEILLDPHRRER
jgi:hypothetical protein